MSLDSVVGTSKTIPWHWLLASGGTAALVWHLFYKLLLYPRYLSSLRHIPGPPLGDVINGQFPTILRGEAGIPQRKWVKEHGPVVRAVGPFGIERLIFTNAAALHKILVSDWVDYPRPKVMRDALGIVSGYGLLTVTGNEHKQMRRAINPAFSIPSLMAQTDMYYDSINGLLDIIQEEIDASEKPQAGRVISIYELMSKATLDIICQTAFGYTADSLHNPHNELAEVYETLIDLQSGHNLVRFGTFLFIPGVPQFIRTDSAYRYRRLISKIPGAGPLPVLIDCMHRIKKVSAQILEERMKESAIATSDTDSKKDIMSLLVRARKAEMEQQHAGGVTSYMMSDEDMMQQVLTFLGAGHETTASGLTWTLWLLANDLESQKKLREEVTPLFADKDAQPGYRDLKELQWLDCVIQESLRVLPPVPMTFRVTSKTDHIDGVLVPKGTILYIPIRVVNTWKENWGEDAEEFRPSRWLNLPPNYNSTTSLLSFLAGPHACIGKTMAVMEMKAMIAALISRFEFTPAYPGQTIKPTAAITMSESSYPIL